MHGICALAGVKLIAIDRPGSGGTPMCASQDRMKVALKQTVSVLCALGILVRDPAAGQADGTGLKPTGPSISILAHSVGFLYALDLIQYFTPTRTRVGADADGTASPGESSRVQRQQDKKRKSSSPFGRRPRLILSSPWVPTSQSKSPLAMVPSSLVRMNSSVMPGLNKAFGALNASFGAVSKTGRGCFGWSVGVVQALPRKGMTVSPGEYGPMDDYDDDNGHADDTDGGGDMVDSEGEVRLSRPSSAAGTHGVPSSHTRDAPSFNPFLSVIGLEPPPSPTRTREKRTRETSLRKHPTASFHPPHTLHYRYSMSHRLFPDPHVSHPSTSKPFTLDSESSGPQLLFDMMAAEGYKGITEDFLLSLGHLPSLSSTALEAKIKQGIEACSKSEKGAEITVVWASGDKIVPAKGRAWLDDLLRQAVASSPLDSRKRKRLRYDRLEMVDAGHDSPMGSEAVVVELLRRAKFGAVSAAPAVDTARSWPSLPLPLPSPKRFLSKTINNNSTREPGDDGPASTRTSPRRHQAFFSQIKKTSRDSAAEARAFEDAERARAAQEDSQRMMRKKKKTRRRLRRRGNSDPALVDLHGINALKESGGDPEEELTASSSQQLRSVDRLLAKKKSSVFASYHGRRTGGGDASAALFAGANSDQRRGFLSVANHQAQMASLSDLQDDEEESAGSSRSSGSFAGSYYSLFSD